MPPTLHLEDKAPHEGGTPQRHAWPPASPTCHLGDRGQGLQRAEPEAARQVGAAPGRRCLAGRRHKALPSGRGSGTGGTPAPGFWILGCCRLSLCPFLRLFLELPQAPPASVLPGGLPATSSDCPHAPLGSVCVVLCPPPRRPRPSVVSTPAHPATGTTAQVGTHCPPLATALGCPPLTQAIRPGPPDQTVCGPREGTARRAHAGPQRQPRGWAPGGPCATRPPSGRQAHAVCLTWLSASAQLLCPDGMARPKLQTTAGAPRSGTLGQAPCRLYFYT